MFPHYRLIFPTYCSGLDWVGKESELAWVDCSGVVVVELDEEELRYMVQFPEASILVNGFPIEEDDVDMARRVDLQDKEDTQESRTKDKAWNKVSEMEDTKDERV